MKLRRSKVITVTYNTEHDVRYRRLGQRAASARSVATRIAQLDDAGTPQEHELKPGSDGGYLWRLNAYWRYEAVPGGVLIECESVSLSRAVPYVLRPFATGLVEGLARESLERTLVGLRTYLTGQIAQLPVSSCQQFLSGEPVFELATGNWRTDRVHLNRSSKAFRALVGATDLVSRSTVVRGSNSVHVLRASFGETRTLIGR